MGQQDLTADVNFTDLQAVGVVRLALTTTCYGTQAETFSVAGCHRRWPAEVHHARPCVKFLLDPSGAGGAFKVLEQVRAPSQKRRVGVVRGRSLRHLVQFAQAERGPSRRRTG